MKIARLTLLAFASLWVASCSWGDDLAETHDQILTVAYKSPEADFSQYKTFAIADSMCVVVDGKKTRVLNPQTMEIYNQVSSIMNGLRYTAVPASENPDLLVDIGYIQSTNTTVSPGYWSDWDWWWKYYIDPWYPYYPYPMPVIVTSYQTGTLVFEIADVTMVYKESSVPVVWHGVVRSILNRTISDSELESAINEVFTILPPK
jgi:hypothetical protein